MSRFQKTPFIQVKFLDERAKRPDKRSASDTGFDLTACIDEPMTLDPQQPTKLIPTGLSIYIRDKEVVGLVVPHSGQAHKKGLVLGNGTGVINADDQEPLYVSAWNRNPIVDMHGAAVIAQRAQNRITIEPGEPIAQLLFVPVFSYVTFKTFEAFEN